MSTFEEKVKEIIGKARAMDDSCLPYRRIHEHIFAPGVGLAWQLLRTPQERGEFCKTKQYAEIQEIMLRALLDKMR